MKESELRAQSGQFLSLLRAAAQSRNFTDTSRPEWSAVRDLLTDLSKSRAINGFTPSETASFVFSLRSPLLELIQREGGLNTKEVTVDLGDATGHAFILNPGKHDDRARQFPILGLQGGDEFESVHPRQVEIEKYAIGPARFAGFQRGFAVISLYDLEPPMRAVLQRQLIQQAIGWVIVNGKDSGTFDWHITIGVSGR
jgi:hypothetical protein